MQQSSSVWTRWAPPVTRNLIVINLLIYITSVLLLRRGIDLNELGGLHYFGASNFHFWQLITYQFLHSTASIDHVLSNMFALFMFGSSIEYFWGSKRYLIYYLLCGVSAGLVQELSWYYELQEVMRYDFVQLPSGLIARDAFLALLNTVGRTLPQFVRPHRLCHSTKDEVLRLPLRRHRALRWYSQYVGTGSSLRSPRWDDRRGYTHLPLAQEGCHPIDD